jgi:hypothetical protein
VRTAKQIASLAALALSGIWLLIGVLIFFGTAWAQLTHEVDIRWTQPAQERQPQQPADLLFQLSEEICTGNMVENGDFTEGPDFRYTWDWAYDGPEREAAYRRATCQFRVQTGRLMMPYEASEVATYFVRPEIELAGHLCVGTPLWILSLVAVRLLYSMHRERRKIDAVRTNT